MSNTLAFYTALLTPHKKQAPDLAAKITRSASNQTYYTIRLLVDRERVAGAYRAYAYFRWLDDCLDAETGTQPERLAFVNRQMALLEACYRGEAPGFLSQEEQMLADLIRGDAEKNSGLQSYLRNMMAVMMFDVKRRGRLISQAELDDYSRWLATAVTDALHYFIGHNCPTPCSETRYQAVYGAHVVHMLRDAVEDTAAGYFNLPREVVEAQGITIQDLDGPAYREWVCGRVKFARLCFQQGREYIAQVKNWRCRLAGFAYTARFEWLLEAIERDNFCLRAAYPERKSLRAGLWMARMALFALFKPSSRTKNYLPVKN
jgi:phytoene/squalene synthetase